MDLRPLNLRCVEYLTSLGGERSRAGSVDRRLLVETVPGNPPFAIKQSGGCPTGQHVCYSGSGGTSAGSPVWAGISRLPAQNLGKAKLGNINPQLY